MNNRGRSDRIYLTVEINIRIQDSKINDQKKSMHSKTLVNKNKTYRLNVNPGFDRHELNVHFSGIQIYSLLSLAVIFILN